MKIADLFFPPRCVFCGKIISGNLGICEDCSGKIPFVDGEVCDRCGCEVGRCSCTPIVNHYDKIVAAFNYEGISVGMISRIKNRGDVQSARMAASFLAEACRRSYRREFDVITCVPTAYDRHVVRGYNPAALIARFMAEEMNVPFAELLKKKPFIRQQKKSDRLERLENIFGAYSVKENESFKRVLIVDDVRTTGATLNECSRLLKRSGAESVCAAAVCVLAKNVDKID